MTQARISMQDEVRTVGDRGLRARLTWRLVAPLALLIVLNSLDRVNVSFAALRMNQDLGLSPQSYGFGISIFFFGYILLQMPHALSLRRVGARAWIFATILVWGAIATAMAFINSPMAFFVLRFLLGVAEGGFAPGVVYILSQWAPRRFLGWAVAGTMLAVPISVVIGAPVSGWLLSMGRNPLGMAAWRWMFLVEGLAPMTLAFVSLAVFSDRLEDARWLSAQEKALLRAELEAESRQAAAAGAARMADAIRNWRVWGCVAVWFSLMAGSYGLLFWMPQVVRQASGANDFTASALSALPWAGIGGGMMLNAWLSDRSQERFWHFGVPAALACLFLACAGSTSGAPALLFVVLGGFFMGAAQGTFWPIPIIFLGSGAAAGGITLINLVGNSSGLISPILIGWIRHASGSFTLPIYAMAALMLMSALLMIPLARASRLARRPS